MTVDVSGTPQKGTPYPVSYPGVKTTHTWGYQADYADWVALGWVPAATSSTTFGPGTDLGGAVWFHDPSSRGADVHGLGPDSLWCLVDGFCGDEIDTIADGFVYDVAPDRRGYKVTGAKLVIDTKFETCPPDCGFPLPYEYVSNPAPFLTIDPVNQLQVRWNDRGTGLSAGEQLSPALSATLLHDRSLMIGAAEPAEMRSDTLLADEGALLTGAVGEPSSPRALTLASDAWGLVTLNVVTPSASGVFGARLVDQPGGALGSILSELFAQPTRVARTATSYSRIADTLIVLYEGTLARRTGLHCFERRRPRPGLGGTWTQRLNPSIDGIGEAPQMVFSPLDGRLWLLDRNSGGFRLRRLHPETGALQSYKSLTALDDVAEAWLRTLEDGRVLLVTRSESVAGHRLALLSVSQAGTGDALLVDGSRQGQEDVLVSPRLHRGLISLLVAPRPSDPAAIVSPRAAAVEVASLVDPWSQLSLDLQRPDVTF